MLLCCAPPPHDTMLPMLLLLHILVFCQGHTCTHMHAKLQNMHTSTQGTKINHNVHQHRLQIVPISVPCSSLPMPPPVARTLPLNIFPRFAPPPLPALQPQPFMPYHPQPQPSTQGLLLK